MKQREKERARVANQSQLTGRLARSGKKNKNCGHTVLDINQLVAHFSDHHNNQTHQILKSTPVDEFEPGII